MNVNFSYIFEKKGTKAPENILKNNLWIDVGNTEKDGIFDHHQDNGFASAFECVMNRPDHYEGLHRYLDEEHENTEVEFHIHEIPDTDCLFSVFAIKKMIDEGKTNPAEVFDKKIADVLLDYVNEIDSGRGKFLTEITLYAYICKIGAEIEETRKRSQECIEEGLKLLNLAVDKLEKSDDLIDLFKTPLEKYIDVSTLKYYSELKEELQNINAAYKRDKKESRVILKSVNLWNTKSEKMKPVKAAIWEKLPSGEDEYNFARDIDECLLTVYPEKIKEENSSEGTTSVIIALNPNMSEAADFTLTPIAETIEQCEQIEEELIFKQTGRYRRDHSQSRKEGGRFDETPFYETSDPWYFSEKGDIIDSPRDDSIIPYCRILSIIENGSFMPKKASIMIYTKGDNDSIEIGHPEDLGNISFGELYRKTRLKIQELKDKRETWHLFAFVKTDPSMLRYSNNWLRACCLNMVGKSDSGFSNDNIFQIDYRTCLYTDQSVTILVAVDRRNQSLDSLINEEKLEESRICMDLKNILERRSELRDIGNSLSNTIEEITQESKKIDEFNERLVCLNTKMEEDDIIADPLEQEVYAFIKNTLGIESLKNSVAASAKLLIENAEQKRDRKEAARDGRIQAGIGLVTIFAVFSALADAYTIIANLLPDSSTGWINVMKHPPIFIAEIIAAIFILCLGVVACKYVVKAWHGTMDKEKNDNSDN